MIRRVSGLLLTLCMAALLLPADSFGQAQRTIPIFWQITKPGTRDTSYLLGTYHLAAADRIAKLPRVKRAFDRSNVVVGEMIFDESSMMSLLPHVVAKHPLKELLSDSEFHALDSAMVILVGESWQIMQNFKPIAIYVTLSMADAAGDDTSATPDFSSAMDIYFQTEAKKKHKKLYGLETADEQASILFDSIPEERQAQGLMEYLRERASQDSSAQVLEDDYYKGQVAEDLVLEGMEKAERGLLLDDRNQRWLAVLPKYLKQHAFVAVGAGHLGGPMGLVEGLRKRGYVLQPIAVR